MNDSYADPRRRPTAVRYAVGVGVLQLLWILMLLLPHNAAQVLAEKTGS